MADTDVSSLLHKLIEQNRLISNAVADRNGLGMLRLMLSSAEVPDQYKSIFYDLPDRALCIDCGANVGLITDIILFMSGRSVCFEPNKTAVNMLQKKYKHNQNVKIEAVAVSDKNSEATLSFYGQYDRGANICGFKGELEKPKNISYTVPTIRLAEYINNLPESVYLLKLDIEGAEFDVIPDLIRSGAVNKCKHVVCETHSRFFKDGPEKLENLKKLISDFNIKNIHMEWI